MRKKVVFICVLFVVTIWITFLLANRNIDSSQREARVRASEYNPSMVHMYGHMNYHGCKSNFAIVNDFGGEDALQTQENQQREHPCNYYQYLLVGPENLFWRWHCFCSFLGWR